MPLSIIMCTDLAVDLSASGKVNRFNTALTRELVLLRPMIGNPTDALQRVFR